MRSHLTLALVAFAAAAFAAETPPPVPTSLADAIAKGKLSFNARLRFEDADQSNLRSSEAYTVRTLLGFTTAPIEGLQGMIQMENVSSLGDTDDYNAAGTNAGGAGRTVIADPTVTDLNQAWLGYTNSSLTLRGGRQRIVLDNARFVGDVGWRQNMQTFDAATATFAPTKQINLSYSYVWRVSRVFGNKAPQPDFTGDVHLINASYSGLPFGKLTGYAYLMDLDNSAANSSNTFGASLTGSAAASADVKLSYRLEYAVQGEAGNNPVKYWADYSLVEVGAAVKPFDFTAGYEVLGSDGTKKGFATPLATLHAFNGWADVFLNTPARGLTDLYFAAGVALPGGFPLKVVYHDFQSDAGHLDYGSEWDAVITHKLGKNWSLLAKMAHYEAAGPFFDVDRLWLQTEFDF